MLFTSSAFFYGYLPLVFVGYYLLGRHSPIWAASWLFVTSVAFYGYWMPEFVFLLLGSIACNFWIGTNIGKLDPVSDNAENRRKAKRWLIAGVTVNLTLLGYFKYAGFFLANINALLGFDWSFGKIILPIGISFFTFTQIAFLADAYLKGTKEYRFVHYGLFVTYFPHLIAGPVLHHAQMMPQFKETSTYRLNVANIAAGLFIFAIGLFKKIVLADGISPYADAVFDASAAGQQPDTIEAWVGALAYTFQLYFDFSGYSDMAIGLSWMFNVRLPYNFDSPYKALNISEFWRRWHMTLSAFLRDYLYISLGGNRNGASFAATSTCFLP
jgi:alginate O-acetyltransferase complex protein AlgI